MITATKSVKQSNSCYLKSVLKSEPCSTRVCELGGEDRDVVKKEVQANEPTSN